MLFSFGFWLFNFPFFLIHQVRRRGKPKAIEKVIKGSDARS